MYFCCAPFKFVFFTVWVVLCLKRWYVLYLQCAEHVQRQYVLHFLQFAEHVQRAGQWHWRFQASWTRHTDWLGKTRYLCALKLSLWQGKTRYLCTLKLSLGQAKQGTYVHPVKVFFSHVPVKSGRNQLILDTVDTEIVNLNHAPLKHGRSQLILDTVHT